MSRADTDRLAADLFDLLEVGRAGVLPFSTAVDALCMVNPALEERQAAAIVSSSSTSGPGARGHAEPVGRDAFVLAVSHSLRTTEARNAARVLYSVVHRLRRSLRQRYLMFDAPPNTPPPVISGNPAVVSMMREMFDSEARGEPYISRDELRRIALRAAPATAGAVENIVKAAMSEDERDLIGFYEFMAVMQPVASQHSLSSVVERFRGVGSPVAPVPSSKAPASAALYGRPPAVSSGEIQGYLAQESEAEQRFQVALQRGRASRNPSLMPSPIRSREHDESPPRAQDSSPSSFRGAPQLHTPEILPRSAKEESVELSLLRRQVAELQQANSTLQRDLLAAQSQCTVVHVQDADGFITELGEDEFLSGESVRLRHDLSRARAQLKSAVAQNDLAEDMTAVAAMLREGKSPQAAMLSCYPEESALASRYAFLVRQVAQQVANANRQRGEPSVTVASSRASSKPGSVAQVSAQYEFIVQGYQALYRKTHRELQLLRGQANARSTPSSRAASVPRARAGGVRLDPESGAPFRPRSLAGSGDVARGNSATMGAYDPSALPSHHHFHFVDRRGERSQSRGRSTASDWSSSEDAVRRLQRITSRATRSHC